MNKSEDNDMINHRLDEAADLCDGAAVGSLGLSLAVQHVVESVLVTDAEGRIEYVNPAFEKASGYGKEDVLGKSPRIWQSGEHNEEFYAELWQKLLSKDVWRGQLCNRRKDGTQYVENAVIRPVIDNEGNVIKYIAVKCDLTKEMAVDRQLRYLQRMDSVGLLASRVAHEFNNLLHSLLGNSEIVKTMLPADSAAHEHVDQMIATCDRAANLTGDLLAFSCKQKLNPRVYNLNRIVAGMEPMLRRMLSQRISLTFKLGDIREKVRVDATEIEHVLLNISLNAQAAMPRGGDLCFTTQIASVSDTSCLQELAACEQNADQAPRGYVLLAVSDTGLGMTADVCEHVFEPFFKGNQSAAGAGLGLSTAYGIIKQHRGFMTAHSRHAEGSTFSMYLPFAYGPCHQTVQRGASC